MTDQVSSFDTKNAPPEVSGIFKSAYDTGVNAGMADDEANRLAMRVVQHAGYYLTNVGWKQIAPDVRGKVQIRQAEKQPDGTFVVRNVPVFYPNAVKTKTAEGEEKTDNFDADRIRTLIKNTNDAISAGAAVPSISDQHPHPLNKIGASIVKPLGRAINWREMPAFGEGWTAVDMVQVNPECIDDWRNGKYPGLSAGIANDAHGLNERFGHVALLGVESPALSMLPSTEVFSTPNQLCFSSDATTYTRGPTMPAPQMNHAVFASACKQYCAAFEAMNAKEPTGEEKVKQAFAGMKKCFDAMGEAPLSTMENPGAANPATPNAEVPPVNYDSNGGFHETQMPEAPKLEGPGTDPPSSIEAAGGEITNAGGAFEAQEGQLRETAAGMGKEKAQKMQRGAMTRMRESGELSDYSAENTALRNQVAALTEAFRKTQREAVVGQFAAELKALTVSGVNFDADSAMSVFTATIDSTATAQQKAASISALRKTIHSVKKNAAASLSDMPQAFAASSNPVGNPSNDLTLIAAEMSKSGVQFDASSKSYANLGAIFGDRALTGL